MGMNLAEKGNPKAFPPYKIAKFRFVELLHHTL